MSAENASVVERFMEKGIRLTPQRISVYKYLLAHRTHPTVDTVYRHLKNENPSLSKTTIYNTVEALSQAGLVRIILSEEGEARLDAYMDLHGHFFCVACGAVDDVPLDGCSFPDNFDQLEISNIDVRLSGRCATCKDE